MEEKVFFFFLMHRGAYDHFRITRSRSHTRVHPSSSW